jgi:hypothetical protein
MRSYFRKLLAQATDDKLLVVELMGYILIGEITLLIILAFLGRGSCG